MDLRLERKYIIDNFLANDFLSLLKFSSLCFNEIFHQRTVNNIYFDDGNDSFVQDNIEGYGTRTKVRLRWYGEDGFKNTNQNLFLELKKRTNEMNYKHIFKVSKFNKTKQNIFSFSKTLTEDNKNFPQVDLINLIPIIQNSYKRRYFLSRSGNIRVTQDTNLIFSSPLSTDFSDRLLSKNIFEIKYRPKDEDEATILMKELPYLVQKCSKYVIGRKILTGDHDYTL